jgi:hypothetical protein
MRSACILVGLIGLLGLSCDMRTQVAKEDNAAARQRVQSTSAEPLDGAKINQIVRAVNASDLSRYASKTLECDGLLVQRDIHERDSEIGREAQITLTVHDPDYEAVRFVCDFAPDDEAKVKSLNIGSKVRIKGEFRGASNSEIDMIGCIIQDAPVATRVDVGRGKQNAHAGTP